MHKPSSDTIFIDMMFIIPLAFIVALGLGLAASIVFYPVHEACVESPEAQFPGQCWLAEKFMPEREKARYRGEPTVQEEGRDMGPSPLWVAAALLAPIVIGLAVVGMCCSSQKKGGQPHEQE